MKRKRAIGKLGVLADAVPRWPDLDDVDVAVGDVGLDLDLIPQVLGHALPSPEADAVQISLGKRHHAFQSGRGQSTSIHRRVTPSRLGHAAASRRSTSGPQPTPITYEAP